MYELSHTTDNPGACDLNPLRLSLQSQTPMGCLLPIDELCSAGHQLSSGQAISRFGVISGCPRDLPSLEELLWL